MTDLRAASRVATGPNHVWVYGNDHSPWVQAVLLGLHERDIAHTLVTVPPLSVFLSSGVLMPAAKIDDGPWLLDSERILVELGFSEVEADERRALQVSFGSGAMQRTEDPWTFWRRFSTVRDRHPAIGRRLWNQFWRAFSIFYFFALITILRRTRPEPTTDQLIREFSFWQERCALGAEFLGGGAPDAGYTHLYTARYFEPKLPEIEPANALERVFYWSGAALMWIAFPITLPTTLYFARRVRKKGLQRP